MSRKETTANATFTAALYARCPRCHQGKMFTGPTYGLKAQKMQDTCSHCGLRFEREPGYFYVAMFVSYAFNVAELVAACIATYIISGNLESPWFYLTIALGVALLLSPLNYRYSRVVLLFWLTPGLHYDENLAKQANTTSS